MANQMSHTSHDVATTIPPKRISWNKKYWYIRSFEFFFKSVKHIVWFLHINFDHPFKFVTFYKSSTNRSISLSYIPREYETLLYSYFSARKCRSQVSPEACKVAPGIYLSHVYGGSIPDRWTSVTLRPRGCAMVVSRVFFFFFKPVRHEPRIIGASSRRLLRVKRRRDLGALLTRRRFSSFSQNRVRTRRIFLRALDLRAL